MNRRGIALLATLWLVTALSVVAAGALMLARIQRGTAIDRVALLRGRVAAEGCLAVLEGTLAAGGPIADTDSIDLGGGLWCRARIEDLGTRVSVEITNAEPLARLIGDNERTAALMDWVDPDDLPRDGGAEREWYAARGLRVPRNAPLGDVAELHHIRGFDSTTIARLTPFLTKWSSTRVDVNTAPREVLETLPGFEPAVVDYILGRRARGEKAGDLDGLLAALPTSLRAAAMARYADLRARVTFAPERVVVRLEGGVPEVPFLVRSTVLGLVADRRLAILAREDW
ncbi:MAG TPA: hypothetical protein VF454_01730 [Gemmatimonadales bacterium]